MGRHTGYGPRSTDARVAEVSRAFDEIGDDVIELEAILSRPDLVVLVGRLQWLRDLIGYDVEFEVFSDSGYAVCSHPRTHLVDVLLSRRRFTDAAKVQNGPEGQPQPEDARLIVCTADAETLAVTWSHPDTGARAVMHP